MYRYPSFRRIFNEGLIIASWGFRRILRVDFQPRRLIFKSCKYDPKSTFLYLSSSTQFFSRCAICSSMKSESAQVQERPIPTDLGSPSASTSRQFGVRTLRSALIIEPMLRPRYGGSRDKSRRPVLCMCLVRAPSIIDEQLNEHPAVPSRRRVRRSLRKVSVSWMHSCLFLSNSSTT